ncbi:hypothetical protein BDY19DRAFT_119551 [Irpex rosettiformis]|uniref:Uncharacterized protein n=1 Tax=Irpex rosettiformis TaxID=378272 RepID=A0ACB8U5T9_9APHY|nr:hypothetical protein BDY19DRAFT_119551 [Irpex rosettiformis]
MWTLHPAEDDTTFFEVRCTKNETRVPPHLDHARHVFNIPLELAELARIFYSQWNIYIFTATRNDRFVGAGLNANDPRAKAFYYTYEYLQRTVVFHFRLNLAIIEYHKPADSDFTDGRGAMSPLVAYAGYVILNVSFRNSFNEEEREAWRMMYAVYEDLREYDWETWAGEDEERRAVLGLDFHHEAHVCDVSDKLVSGFMAFKDHEYWLGDYLRRRALEQVEENGLASRNAKTLSTKYRQWLRKHGSRSRYPRNAHLSQEQEDEFISQQLAIDRGSGWELDHDGRRPTSSSATTTQDSSRAQTPRVLHTPVGNRPQNQRHSAAFEGACLRTIQVNPRR